MTTRPSARADLLSALLWMALGAAIVYGSWTMDRLERHGAKLFTAPGLVPGLLGLVLLVLGAVLAVRALRSGALRARVAVPTGGTTTLVLFLCLGYALGLLGRLPFWLATFLFVALFVAVFEYPSRVRMALGLAYGAAAAAAVTLLFESVFLVRLP